MLHLCNFYNRVHPRLRHNQRILNKDK
jgi:hypothetical protein